MGLGNPGARYASTRHNIGFRVCEELAARLRAVFAPAWPEYRAAVVGDLTLLEPLTYMNRSGDALAAWRDRAGHPDALPVVVCDDLHLPLGSLRIRERGGAGGQNGLESVLAAVGHEDVARVRLGVGPRTGAVPPEAWADYVLEPFAADEQDAVADLVGRAADAVLCLLESGVQAAASRHNWRFRPSPDLPDARP